MVVKACGTSNSGRAACGLGLSSFDEHEGVGLVLHDLLVDIAVFVDEVGLVDGVFVGG